MDFGWLRKINIGLPIITNILLWLGMSIMEEAMNVVREEIHKKSPHLPLNFAMNLKLL